MGTLENLPDDPILTEMTTGTLVIEVMSELPADEVRDRLAEQAVSFIAAMSPDVLVIGVQTPVDAAE